MSYSPFDARLDPACGSLSFLDEVLRHSYNQQPLARLAEEKSQPEEEFQVGIAHRVVKAVVQAAAVAAIKSQPHIKLREEGDREQLHAPTSYDRALISLALDQCSADTVHLSLSIKNIVISPDHKLKIRRAANEEHNSILCHTSDGAALTGVELTWSSKNGKKHGSNIHFRINRMRRGWIDGHNVGCHIQFSLEGLLGLLEEGQNAWPVPTKNTAMGVVQLVQDILQGIGVTADLRGAKIVRCDVNRNMVLDDAFANYQPLFNALDQPRTEKRDFSETGISCNNKSQRILFYDKIAEMKKSGKKRSITYLPENLARCEWQVLGAKNVRKKLQISTVQDLFDRWYELPSHFDAQIGALFSREIAKFRAPQPRLDRLNRTPIQNQIDNLFRWCRKHGLSQDLNPQLLEDLVREGNLPGYAHLVRNIPEMDNKHANDAVRRMRDAFWRERFQDPKFTRQYEEVQKKLAGGHYQPRFSIADLRQIKESATRKLIYRGPYDRQGDGEFFPNISNIIPALLAERAAS